MKYIKTNKLITTILILYLFLLLPYSTIFAEDTHKVNEEIIFGRTYEFDEPVNGSIVVSSSVDEIISVGNTEEGQYVSSVPVSVRFTPDKVGIYKLNIEVNVLTESNIDLSRVDTVYFLVTEDGRDMSEDEIKDYLNDNIQNTNTTIVNEYTNRPYIKELIVKNAKVVEKVDKGRSEYTLEINDNAQEIEFLVTGNTEKTIVQGTLKLNPNLQNTNFLSVSNGNYEVIYTFRWKSPNVKVFNYINKNGDIENLVYDPYIKKEFEGLKTQIINISGTNFEVYEDESGNLLIPLKRQKTDDLPDLYTFTTDGEIISKFENFININSETFRQEEYKKVFKEDLVLFNLEEVEIPNLNYANGYKINRTGYENMYIVNLTRPDGYKSWYQYNDSEGVHQVLPLSFPDFITEQNLAEFFGVELETDYKKFEYSYVDIVLISIAAIAIVIIIITKVVILIKKSLKKKKKRK